MKQGEAGALIESLTQAVLNPPFQRRKCWSDSLLELISLTKILQKILQNS